MKSDDSRIFDALSASNIEGAVQDFDKERKRLLKNEETIADSERRWIWELLQNAKDVADGKFKAKILLHDRYVQFFHNGKSFTDSDLLALISHKTSKRKQKRTNSSGTYKKPTGKFGSGFVSTFLIAPKVIIESLFYDLDKDSDRSFSIELDRDIRNYHEDEQIEKDIKKSFEAWKNIVCNRNDEYQEEEGERQDFTTSFRYELTKEGNAAIQTGIQDIKRSIGFTLAFIPELESVEIDNQIEKQKIVYSASHERSVEDNLKRTKVFQSIDGSPKEEIYKIVSIFREYKLEDSEISVSLSVAFKNNEIYIDPKNPTLYCSLPLVGTEEKFKYSTVINSSGFYPLEHRNDIPLGSEQATEGPRNRQIFEILVPLYEELLHQMAKEKIKNLYLLANFE
ncbi:MAG: hypothetical protein F6K16_32530, partial [Symploca sp. SIO2B6]|nr:hypothetical protein [Symploca sp. SIO2B6]